MQKKKLCKPPLVTVNSTCGMLPVSRLMYMHVAFNLHEILRGRPHYYQYPHLQVEKLRHREINNIDNTIQLIKGRVESPNQICLTRKRILKSDTI